MDEITSTRNPHVKELASLARRRERREQGRHLVEGPNAVGAALAAGVVTEVLVTDEGLVDAAALTGVRLVHVTEHVLERVARTSSPQGVVAVARNVTASLSEVVGHGFMVVLDEVADPGNAGTIVRTADAAGASGVVTTAGSVDLFGPKAVRAAAGSTYHLPVVTEVERGDLAAACLGAGQTMYGLDGTADRGVQDLEHASPPLALVLGNEAHGLDEAMREYLDVLVAIPLHGRAESLNVSAAAAVAIYAAARSVHPSRTV